MGGEKHQNNFTMSFSLKKMLKEKMVISKKRNLFGQTLAFLPIGKPSFYISRLYLFSFEHFIIN